ncbi:FAD-binding protein [Desulfovibrio sp. OttesenSCG-928-G15]|nr:FAD-binding protein [Desulfovibrio sp. OttesenSCG-928-G15]
MPTRNHRPVLIIGAGLAGCIAALRLADLGIESTVIAATTVPRNANSWLAQGGIIYTSGEADDAQKLEKDITTAGHSLNLSDAVSFLAQQGPGAVRDMLMRRVQVPFDTESDHKALDLTREGGHSAKRIAHCADHTGLTIMETLLPQVKSNPAITYQEGYTAIDLLTSHHQTKGLYYRYQLENQCCGAYVLNEATDEVETMLADVTILATGGAGQVYLHSSNAPTAIGSGIAMASRAFVRLMNMEYMQFHPTTLFHLEPKRFLITEALRGEGARLFNAKGEYFMKGKDPREDLAPRDIVSRVIVDELLSSGEPCVFLDLSEVKHIEERFPTVLQSCLDRGIDIRSEPIPVVPAAHYFCGGILVDRHGRSSLSRLYAIGECSCTGLHGSNRLASTSLMEAVLWGKTAAEDIAARLGPKNLDFLAPMPDLLAEIEDWFPSGDEHNDDPALIAQDWATIRNTMWNYVGITRTTPRLTRAFEDLRDLSRHLHNFYRSTPLSRPIVDLFHGCQTAYLITQSALRNKRNIGCHHRI